MKSRGRSRRAYRCGLLGVVLVAGTLGGAASSPGREPGTDARSGVGLVALSEEVGSTAAQEAVEDTGAGVRTSSPPIVPVTRPGAPEVAASSDVAATAAVPAQSPAREVPSSGPAVTATAGGPDARDLPGWSLLFAEHFDRDAPLGRFASVYGGWAGYDGGADTSRSYGRSAVTQGRYDSGTTTSVHDGVVDEYVHTAAGVPQVVALTPTPDGSWWSGQTYGRYAVRFRADDVPGYKLAFLLWPSSDDWSEGEIDFPEGSLGKRIELFSHDVSGDPSGNAFHVVTGTSMSEWHTAVIEWSPGRLSYRLDDSAWTTTDSSAVPSSPMRWVLQTETELTADAPDPTVSGHVLIDWAAVWRLG